MCGELFNGDTLIIFTDSESGMASVGAYSRDFDRNILMIFIKYCPILTMTTRAIAEHLGSDPGNIRVSFLEALIATKGP